MKPELEISQTGESSNHRSAENSTKDTWRDDTSIKSAGMSIITADFDDTGFIEVKAKKKPEKEKKMKTKKDNKDGWRKKKDKDTTEKRKPTKENAQAKTSSKPIETKKRQLEKPPIKPTDILEKLKVVEKVIESEAPQKTNIGVSKIIINPSFSSKSNAPKPIKTNIPNDTFCGSDNSSEGEPVSSKTTNKSTTSHSSTNQSAQNATINNMVEPQPATQNQRNYRGHPLSIASPSLDFDMIRISKAKDFANEFFNKKFETDIYKHVANLTEEANKMMDYRILAYKRLDYCIASLFQSSCFLSFHPKY